MEFTLNNEKYDLCAHPNISIVGNTACGKTTITRRIAKSLLSNGIKPEVIGSKASFEYNDIDCEIVDIYPYTDYIDTLFSEYENRKTQGVRDTRVIVIDDLSDVAPTNNPTKDDSYTTKLSSLLKNGHEYGMYFIIISQRITDSVYKPDFRDNTHIHIYMRTNNAMESEFLIGDDSLSSLNRGEYKIEIK